MKISEHADHTEKTVGLRAEDIHKWLDGFFDTENFLEFLNTGQNPKFDPYDHRKFRHCKEAIEQAYKEFDGKYTPDQIKAVFECHIKDDYDGYLPSRDDFANGTFTEKYHECIERSSSEKILSEVELSEYFKGKAYINYKQEKKKKFTAFHFKIVLPVIIAMVLFLASLFVIIVPIFHENMMDSKKEMERELTRTATSIIHRYIEQEQQGLLTRAQAQQKAIAEMNELRYGKEMKDYFWITDMQPKMIMHPYRQDLIGKDLSNYTDSKDRSGKKLFVEFVNLIEKNNEGFLEYLWQWKDDSTQLVPKLSYVKAIPEWDWIVGTGIYIDDVEEEIGKLEQNLMLAFLIIAMIIFVIILYSYRLDNKTQ
jgi:CBS domain-containing protein